MKKKCFLVLGLLFLLAGCGRSLNETYLVKHPDLLKAKVESCRALGASELNNANCMFAEDVFLKANQYYSQLIQNQSTFGQNVLTMQMQLGQLDQQIAKDTKNKRLLQQRSEIKYHLNIMLALISSATGL